jgi:hypothetical protein
MRTRIGSSAISRFAGMMITACFCGTGPAWAGGGGSDAGAFQGLLQQVCDLVGATSCYQVPTLAQVVLGISDYQNTPPDFVRGPLGNVGMSGGGCSFSGNPLPLCSETNAVTTVNPLTPSSNALSDLANLTPLAFQAVSGQPATPVALGSPNANSFLYAVLTGPDGQHTLDVVFDYGPWTTKTFVKNQPVGSFTFPLVILNSDNSEIPVVATLQLTATCNGAAGCLAGSVTGVGTKPLNAAQLGIQFGFQLATSPNVPNPHAIFDLKLPVIVTKATDSVYFGVDSNGTATFINQFSGQPTAFSQDDRGFTPTSVGMPIGPIGVSPYPAPLCPAAGCPSTTPPAPTFYGFCATIADTPTALTFTPAAATFVSIGTDGTTYVSSPIPPPGGFANPPLTCP